MHNPPANMRPHPDRPARNPRAAASSRLATVMARGASALALLLAVAINPLSMRPFAGADGLSPPSVRLLLLLDLMLVVTAALLLFVPRSRGVLLRLGLAIGLPLLAAELMLRVFNPLGTSYFFDTPRYFARTVPSEDFAYIHEAGARFTLTGVPFEINSDGLRGPEMEKPKPAGRRVLLLGDSVVLGYGVPVEDTFAARLRVMLAARGADIDIVAAGVGSWNTRTEREWLRARGWALEPDVVVLVPVPNDVEPKTTGRTEVPHAELARARPPPAGMLQIAASRSWLLTSIMHVARKRSAAARTDDLHGGSSPAWRDQRLAFAGIALDCRRRHVPLIVFPFGPPEPAGDGRSSFRVAWSGALREEGIPEHDLPAEAFEPGHHVSLTDPHPDAAAHALIAAAMLPAIEKALPVAP